MIFRTYHFWGPMLRTLLRRRSPGANHDAWAARRARDYLRQQQLMREIVNKLGEEKSWPLVAELISVPGTPVAAADVGPIAGGAKAVPVEVQDRLRAICATLYFLRTSIRGCDLGGWLESVRDLAGLPTGQFGRELMKLSALSGQECIGH